MTQPAGRILLVGLLPVQVCVLHGGMANDLAGFGVSSAGDVNGDGIDEVLIGAQGADIGGRRT